jgi:hypothetical protein
MVGCLELGAISLSGIFSPDQLYFSDLEALLFKKPFRESERVVLIFLPLLIIKIELNFIPFEQHHASRFHPSLDALFSPLRPFLLHCTVCPTQPAHEGHLPLASPPRDGIAFIAAHTECLRAFRKPRADEFSMNC